LTRIRALLLVSLALVAAVAIAACGDDGGDEDPQEVLEATFNNEEQISSGVLDATIKFTAEGGEDEGTVEASLGGPFESSGDGSVPSFDITAEGTQETTTGDFSGSAGITSTGNSGFVNIQGTDYEVPAALFDEFTTAFTDTRERLGSFAVDPTNWLTDLSNEGNEDVGGTDTIHISGEAEVPKLVEELKGLVENLPEQVTPEELGQLDQLNELVKTAELDVYSGADDDILRKLEGKVEIDPPDTEGASDSLTLEFSLQIADLNEPQEIAAPSGAQPLGDLLEQFGVDPSQLGAIGAAGGGGGGNGSSGGGTSPASQAYLDCLGEAQGQEELDQCAPLIGQ
jgi:hypothetical protein